MMILFFIGFLHKIVSWFSFGRFSGLLGSVQCISLIFLVLMCDVLFVAPNRFTDFFSLVLAFHWEFFSGQTLTPTLCGTQGEKWTILWTQASFFSVYSIDSRAKDPLINSFRGKSHSFLVFVFNFCIMLLSLGILVHVYVLVYLHSTPTFTLMGEYSGLLRGLLAVAVWINVRIIKLENFWINAHVLDCINYMLLHLRIYLDQVLELGFLAIPGLLKNLCDAMTAWSPQMYILDESAQISGFYRGMRWYFYISRHGLFVLLSFMFFLLLLMSMNKWLYRSLFLTWENRVPRFSFYYFMSVIFLVVQGCFLSFGGWVIFNLFDFVWLGLQSGNNFFWVFCVCVGNFYIFLFNGSTYPIVFGCQSNCLLFKANWK